MTASRAQPSAARRPAVTGGRGACVCARRLRGLWTQVRRESTCCCPRRGPGLPGGSAGGGRGSRRPLVLTLRAAELAKAQRASRKLWATRAAGGFSVFPERAASVAALGRASVPRMSGQRSGGRRAHCCPVPAPDRPLPAFPSPPALPRKRLSPTELTCLPVAVWTEGQQPCGQVCVPRRGSTVLTGEGRSPCAGCGAAASAPAPASPGLCSVSTPRSVLAPPRDPRRAAASARMHPTPPLREMAGGAAGLFQTRRRQPGPLPQAAATCVTCELVLRSRESCSQCSWNGWLCVLTVCAHGRRSECCRGRSRRVGAPPTPTSRPLLASSVLGQ